MRFSTYKMNIFGQIFPNLKKIANFGATFVFFFTQKKHAILFHQNDNFCRKENRKRYQNRSIFRL